MKHFNSDFLQTKTFRVVILCLGIFIFSLVIFWVGMAVGFRRAVYSVEWGQNYEKNFLGPRRPMMGGGQFLNDHGTVGEVVSINGDILVVRADDGVERSILASTSTTIRQFDQSLTLADLKLNERVVIIGEPNANGEIEAKIIRVFPGNQPDNGTGMLNKGQTGR